ncbi:WD40 repeat, partial [Dillenia turbinata]
MIPERRLEHLAEQALDVQRDSCVFHNSLDSEFSLYLEHQCSRNQIPSQTFQLQPETATPTILIWLILRELNRLDVEGSKLTLTTTYCASDYSPNAADPPAATKKVILTLVHRLTTTTTTSMIRKILEAHKDEVWFLQFLHNGKYLASLSKDQTAIIWEYGAKAKGIVHGPQTPVKDKARGEDSSSAVMLGSRIAAMDQFIMKLQIENKLKERERNEAHKKVLEREEEVASLRAKLELMEGRGSETNDVEDWSSGGVLKIVRENNQVSVKHILIGHHKLVMAVSWSPDDCQLLTCGLEEAIRGWDAEKQGVGLISCGWFPNGKGVFCGLTDRSISLWDLDGREIECWNGQRTLKISNVAITNDGKRIISICKETAIVLHDWEERYEIFTGKSDKPRNPPWGIRGENKVVGHKRTHFIIRFCFGGFKQGFIASVSEDSQHPIMHNLVHPGAGDQVNWRIKSAVPCLHVYIWHRGTGELLQALPGHSGAVNCTSWNPVNPLMLASARDDHSIQIWRLDRVNLPCEGSRCNAVLLM